MNIFKERVKQRSDIPSKGDTASKVGYEAEVVLGVWYERVNERVSSSNSCLNNTEHPLTIFYFA